MIEASIAARANALLAKGDKAGAIALVDAASSVGQADALLQMAIWLLVGAPVARDVPRARALLRRAVTGGHAEAAMMEIALSATGSGAPADWRETMTLLRAQVPHAPLAATQMRMIEAMALTEDGSPAALPAAERLSSSPDVQRFPRLLSPAECEHLAMAAQDILEPAVIIDPQTGKMVAHPIRTSHGAVIGPTRETAAIRAINRRIAAISGTQVAQGEPLSILRYAPGQQYRAHLDAIAGAANQRIATVLIYLNQGYVGGETHFTATGLTTDPQAGDAILFSNVLSSGTPDPRSQHAGLPVTRGVKWLATRWIRAQPYDPWNPPRP